MAGEDGPKQAEQDLGQRAGQATFNGIMMDRKKMEEDRLARLKRRRGEAAVDEPESQPASQRARHGEKAQFGPSVDDDSPVVIREQDFLSAGKSSHTITGGRAIAAAAAAATATNSSAQRPSTPSSATQEPLNTLSSISRTKTELPSQPPSPPLPYLDGVIKRTWADGHPRRPDDVRLAEILDKDKLELAVISSFQWDGDWLMEQIDVRRTRLMMVAHAPDEKTKLAMAANTPPNTRFCFPDMDGWGCMHSKLQLLKFAGHLRIVVPTGNMVPYDWGEMGVMENMMFIIDLPRLDDPDTFIPTEFSIELFRFLTACKLDAGLVHSLTRYDFSRTADLAFVHTIAGKHEGDDWRCTGYPGLSNAVKTLGMATQDRLEVECVTASMGSLTNKFLESMYRACQGFVGSTVEPDAKPARKTKPTTQPATSSTPSTAPANAPLDSRLRVLFPSEETVANSRGGKDCGGTICFSSKRWSSPTFPRTVLRNSLSTRPRLLLHTKAILVRPAATSSPASSSADIRSKSWVYIGSSNLSESAWGTLAKDRKTGKERLTCRNWECGVVFPVSRIKAAADEGAGHTLSSDAGNTSDGAQAMTAAFASLPLPVRFPAERYAEAGPGSHPWFVFG